jgi:hypothetical protein
MVCYSSTFQNIVLTTSTVTGIIIIYHWYAAMWSRAVHEDIARGQGYRRHGRWRVRSPFVGFFIILTLLTVL